MSDQQSIYQTSLKVGDIGICLNSNLDLKPTDYFDTHSNPQARLILHHGEQRSVFFEHPYNELVVITDLHYGQDHLLRQLLIYLCSFNSDIYNPIHGCGLLINDKGVLLVGKAGSGKSPTSNMFRNSKTLDDDLLLTDGSKMYVSGRLGAVTTHFEAAKFLDYQPEGIKNAPIHVVFLLNKDLKSGEYKKNGNIIPRDYAVFDSLPYLLQERYLELPPIRVNCPVFILGTMRYDPESIKSAILGIINNST